MSLRRRLIIGILAVAAVLVVTNVLLASQFRSYLMDRLDLQVEGVANRPLAQPGQPGGPPPGANPTGGPLYQATIAPDGTVTPIAETATGAPVATLAVVAGHVARGARPIAFNAP